MARPSVQWPPLSAARSILSGVSRGALTPGNHRVLPLTTLLFCIVKVGEILRVLERDGWRLVATRGSHRQFKHPSKIGRVTVSGKPSDDLAPGTLNSILKQAGLK
jgi:predicted RNA binding protein YcfA (HicA-like mRNA interferase family)